MSNNSLTTTTPLRTKEPVYTSDKRAKFKQGDSKNWIRLCSVLGYIFFVSLPAISLTIYYIWIWDPNYISRFPPDKDRTLKTDYTTRPISTTRQVDQSSYNQNVFEESSTSRTISKNPVRAFLQPSPETRNNRLQEQKPLKVSQHMESSNSVAARLKMKPKFDWNTYIRPHPRPQFSKFTTSLHTSLMHIT